MSGAQLATLGHDAESGATVARGTFIGSGVLALSAAVMAFFTDWYGYAQR